MKKVCYLFFIVLLFLGTGCENKEEEEKNNYIAYRNNLFSRKDYSSDLPFELVFDIEREDEQTIHYKVTFSNPKENMHQIKAMVVNNYSNDDVFPSVGLFDEKEELLVDVQENSSLELEGKINSTKDLSKLKLNLKIWISYQTDIQEKKEFYYQT